jgi:salicylate hydroxylase
MNSPPIIIAGGGIAGLAASLAISPHHEVLVLEQAECFSEVGAGLQLGPNAMRALHQLGAADAVEAITTSPPEIHMRDAVSGKLLKRLPLGRNFATRHGAPYRVAHRADLHAALLGLARAQPHIVLQTGTRLIGLDSGPGAITLRAGASSYRAQAVIAADGVNSIIRQTLFPGSAAIDSGDVFHRCLIKPPAITGLAMDCVNLWLFPGGHVVHYPVGGDGKLNLVVVTPRGSTPKQFFGGACDTLQQLLAAMPTDASPWPGLYAPPVKSWVSNGVLLLGDAAHATLPYLAQGAAMSLEDAACLAQVLPTTHSLKHAFAETANRRMARAARLQHESVKAGKTYHLSGPLRLARNIALGAMPNTLLQARLDWLYNG